MRLNYQTQITVNTKFADQKAIQTAVETLRRDIRTCCNQTDQTGAEIRLVDQEQEAECYTLVSDGKQLEIQAGDIRGFIYGIYKISRDILGIHDFWFWYDQKIEKKDFFEIRDGYAYVSLPWKVRYRGWFVNDEVLLHKWMFEQSKDKPWAMVFETLLRCGGNMVIPGTDTNSKKYRKLASDMGLMITHHHAEPLGAEMFARAFPNLTPSYDKYPEKFQQLWKAGIEEQQDMEVIWNIGFRGQGDCPFWNNDPNYDTPQSRGKLMSDLIRLQYDLVKSKQPSAICCTNLYGETMELYKEGWLQLPEDVIRIWADNGYGKMVTRRQENHNPRIEALPSKADKGKNGIYYHASFYDLQAANHMTMLPNEPEFIVDELRTVLSRNGSDYWLINCSNVKPHVYFLDLIATMWRDGDVDVAVHRKNFLKKYFGEPAAEIIEPVWKEYPKYALQYGSHEDDHAGEQFANHPARILISQYMKDAKSRAEELLWQTDRDTLREQIEDYRKLCEKAVENYTVYHHHCLAAEAELDNEADVLFKDSLELQVKMYLYCFTGAKLVCESLISAMDQAYQMAFYKAGKARQFYLLADAQMRSREHGKWHNFYQNECLTDIKQTAWVLKGLMSYIRNLGDGPHFYEWQREFLYSEEDRRVVLVMNMENHMEDDELFALMEEKFGR